MRPMPYRSMSLEEFAKHVGMDAREVRRLADRGKLPGHKVGGQWRFNRARVTEWLQQEMHTLAKTLRDLGIERTFIGHCSGKVAQKAFRDEFKDDATDMSMGLEIEV